MTKGMVILVIAAAMMFGCNYDRGEVAADTELRKTRTQRTTQPSKTPTEKDGLTCRLRSRQNPDRVVAPADLIFTLTNVSREDIRVREPITPVLVLYRRTGLDHGWDSVYPEGSYRTAPPVITIKPGETFESHLPGAIMRSPPGYFGKYCYYAAYHSLPEKGVNWHGVLRSNVVQIVIVRTK